MGTRAEVEKLLTEALDKAVECIMPGEYHKKSARVLSDSDSPYSSS